MEDNELATNGQTKALIQAIRIINRENNDPRKLDAALQEIASAIDKDASAGTDAT